MNPDEDQGDRLSRKLGSSTTIPKPPAARKPWRGVFFEGPEPDQDKEGDEIPVWFVFVGNKEADPIGKVYRCLSFGPAEELARRMSQDRKLELVHEAMPA